MRIAASSDRETIAQTKTVPTPTDFEQGIQILRQISGELSGEEKIASAVGGIAGALDKDHSILVASPHLKGWVQKPLKKDLENIFGCRVTLENDTALNGLGEAVKGAGLGYSIVAYLGIGTGIGGVRIVGQKIDENSLGFEPGHQVIVADGNPCNCGGKGHLEAYVAGSYIEKIYQQKAEDIKDESIWEEIAQYLALGLNNTIVHWSPDIVVLGGSVAKSLPLDSITTYLKNELKMFPQAPQIVLAALGDNAGLYGALELLK